MMTASRCLTSGTVRGSRSNSRSFRSTPPNSILSDGGEIGEGQHGEGDVTVPTRPGADFVLVQPDFAFAVLEQALDGPARSGDLHQLIQRRPFGSMREIERQVARVGDRSAHQQAAAEACGTARVGPGSPVVQAGSLGTVARAQPLPVRLAQSCRTLMEMGLTMQLLLRYRH